MQRRRGMLFRVDVYAPLFWPMESERDGFTGLYFSISGAHTLYKTRGKYIPVRLAAASLRPTVL